MQHDIKPGIKGLIFDLDGTLAKDGSWHVRNSELKLILLF